MGTTALNGALLDNLESSIGSLTAEKRALEADVNDLRDLVSGDDQLVEQLAERTVAGVLPGERVVVVSGPSAASQVRDELVPLLQAAGAEVTGEVRLRAELADPARAAQVDAVVDAAVASAPAGVDLDGADGAVERAAAVLAAALVRAPDQDADTGPAASGALQAFADADLVDVEGEVGARATLAVVLAGAPDPVPDPARDPVLGPAQTGALVAVADALDEGSSGAVVAAPLAAVEDGGVLQAVRRDGALSGRVSSVDGADRPSGRLAVVLALREQAGGGAGRYGTAAGVTGALPPLPPPPPP